jgi:ferritin
MEYKGYSGAAKLFRKYAAEELLHADKSYDRLLALDFRPTVPALQAPPEEFEGLVQVIDLAYKHELKITEQCSELAELAMAEADFMTLTLAQWYLTEQAEEIKKTTDLLNYIDVLGGDSITPTNLWLLDERMGKLA